MCHHLTEDDFIKIDLELMLGAAIKPIQAFDLPTGREGSAGCYTMIIEEMKTVS